jgi:uncharacterized protein YjbI with pentapeptide repeats
MANEEHLTQVKQGVEAWNAWRMQNYFITPDLTGAHLSGENLRKANFSETNLTGAHLCNARLDNANFRWANLTGADLRWAILTETDLWG